MTTILPSIASADPADLGGEIRRLNGHPHLHFDLEDGNFVPNITFGMKTIRALRPLSDAAFDAHLMVTDPLSYIPGLLQLGFQAIAFHWEASGYPLRILHAIQDGGCRAGIALNPRTPCSVLAPYLSHIDYALVMTSEPDGRGDQFQPAMLEKIQQLHRLAPGLPIVADGAIDKERLPSVLEAGAHGVVIGRAIFSSPDPYAAILRFQASSAAQ